MDFEDDDLVMNFSIEPNDGVEAFAGSYKGAYTVPASNPYYFTLDGNKSEVRTVFAKQEDDGIAFYVTSGNIDNANDLDKCHYYARLFVPTSEMDGTDIDIKGTKQYDLQLVDNVSDLTTPQYFTAFTGVTGNASGYVSVLDGHDGSYTLIADVTGLGLKGVTHDLQFYYKGTPLVYDLSKPNQYVIGDNDPVALKSAAYTVDEAAGLYTIYLSSKENVATLEGMADADFVITVPEAFVSDGSIHGFSGEDINAKASITFGGDKYCQETVSGDGAIAMGGNTKTAIDDGKINIDFNLFGIVKHNNRNMIGHFEGNVTKLN